MRRAGLQTRGTGKPAATGNLEPTAIPAEFPTDNPFAPMMVSRRKMRKDTSSLHLMMMVMMYLTMLDNKAVQFATAKNLPLLRFSIVFGRTQFKSRQSMEGED